MSNVLTIFVTIGKIKTKTIKTKLSDECGHIILDDIQNSTVATSDDYS